ncbi:acyl-CoA-like ligand-binding transcription factor [Sinosporangium siamense]|uniref:acyl-CoA-like ligand-binding transcription factor n=1 Tax=Sinosporangium siamense TaxID=1367973 RepID=UPI001951DEEE|nr:hypothetical protein [Sinosporangium siamense]
MTEIAFVAALQLGQRRVGHAQHAFDQPGRTVGVVGLLLVLGRDRFPPLIEALAAQPPGAPTTVLHGAFREAFAALSAKEIAAGHEREVFAATVPELLVANLRRSPDLIGEVCAIVADRAGCAEDDPRIRNAVGAVLGVVAMVWAQWARNSRLDGPAEIDKALAHLESGLSL